MPILSCGLVWVALQISVPPPPVPQQPSGDSSELPSVDSGEPPSPEAPPEPEVPPEPELPDAVEAPAEAEVPAEPEAPSEPEPAPEPVAPAPAPAPAPGPAQPPSSAHPQPQRAAPAPVQPLPPSEENFSEEDTNPGEEDGMDFEPQEEPSFEPASSPEEEKKPRRRLGQLSFLRLGIAPKAGYTFGTSQKNGLFDRDKSIQESIDSQMMVVTGAGDLGNTQFGGWMYGFEVDLEIFFVNAWLDFHKFFNPGGMWSLLVGYDHEFGLGRKKERVRFDIGAGFGLMRVFLGDAFKQLYYNSDNPEQTDIATTGMEGRVSAALQFRLVGPLFTGPTFVGGYHYLWSANAAEVTEEKGFHFNGAWTLRLDFAFLSPGK